MWLDVFVFYLNLAVIPLSLPGPTVLSPTKPPFYPIAIGQSAGSNFATSGGNLEIPSEMFNARCPPSFLCGDFVS